MKLIYNNFDKLEVSFQGAFPQELIRQLHDAKLAAQQQKSPALVALGEDEIKVHVQETGRSGGYAYVFDTGPDGTLWAVSSSRKADGWNIYVSVSSMGLALHGYMGMKRYIYDLLRSFKVKPPSQINPVTCEPFNWPIESISRVDYCFDFETSGFEPDASLFIAYRGKKRSEHGKLLTPYSAESNGKSIETFTLGKMPYRQVSLYNKLKEVANKPVDKGYWFSVWKKSLEELDEQVWRAEVRAGKKELKTWGVVSFEDLEDKVGDVVRDVLNKYRYVTATPSDSNKARWSNAPFWDDAITASGSALSAYSSGAERGEVLLNSKAEKEVYYKNGILGSIINYTALKGLDISEVVNVIKEFGENFSNDMEDVELRLRYMQKHQKAADRFVFLADI